MNIDLKKITSEVKADASELGWETSSVDIASTGTIYLELRRDRREWAVIRIANHNQFYHK